MNQRVQPPLLADVAVGILAGLVATKATDLAQGPLRLATPEGAKRREARVSPGPSSSHVAARRVAERLGRPVEDRRLRPVAKAVHHGLGMAWGPVYCLLRRHGLPHGPLLWSGGEARLSAPPCPSSGNRCWRCRARWVTHKALSVLENSPTGRPGRP